MEHVLSRMRKERESLLRFIWLRLKQYKNSKKEPEMPDTEQRWKNLIKKLRDESLGEGEGKDDSGGKTEEFDGIKKWVIQNGVSK